MKSSAKHVWLLSAVAALTFLLTISPDALAKKKSTKSSCIAAGMIVIQHANGGYECCVNYGFAGLEGKCDLVQGSCLVCDRDNNCVSEPPTAKSNKCDIKITSSHLGERKLRSFELQRSIAEGR